MGKTDLSLIDFEAHYFITKNRERLNGLANYLALMDTQVARIETEQSEELKQDLETIPDSWSDTDQISFIQWREHEYQQFNNTFAENFRYSFIVLAWLVVEDELKSVCREVQQRKGLPPQQWKSKGVIDQCKEILTELTDRTNQRVVDWSNIRDLQKIRDCIVHTSGFIDGSRDKSYLISLVERKNLNLQIDDFDRRFKISTEYCRLAVQSITEFFSEILSYADIRSVKTVEKE